MVKLESLKAFQVDIPRPGLVWIFGEKLPEAAHPKIIRPIPIPVLLRMHLFHVLKQPPAVHLAVFL